MIGRPWTLAGPADDRRADRDRRGAGPPRPVQEPPELVRMTLAPARGSHRGQRPRGRTQRPDGWQQPRTKTCPSRPQNPCGPGGVHGWTGRHPISPALTKPEEGPAGGVERPAVVIGTSEPVSSGGSGLQAPTSLFPCTTEALRSTLGAFRGNGARAMERSGAWSAMGARSAKRRHECGRGLLEPRHVTALGVSHRRSCSGPDRSAGGSHRAGVASLEAATVFMGDRRGQPGAGLTLAGGSARSTASATGV